MTYPHETPDEMIQPAKYRGDTRRALADLCIYVDSEDYEEPDVEELRDRVADNNTMLDMDDVEEYATELHHAMENGRDQFEYEVWYT